MAEEPESDDQNVEAELEAELIDLRILREQLDEANAELAVLHKTAQAGAMPDGDIRLSAEVLRGKLLFQLAEAIRDFAEHGRAIKPESVG